MKNFLKHIIFLGFKEIKSFFNDKVFLIFVTWAFTLNIIVAAKSANMDIQNASIAIVNEDNSPLSRSIIQSLRKPFFKTPQMITFGEIDHDMDMGNYTFVLVIPSRFQANLLSGKTAEIQLNIDATVMTQGYIGSNYIKQIVTQEIENYLMENGKQPQISSYDHIVRIKYNPNIISEWFMAIAQMVNQGTMLSMLLPAVAMVRERESGTIEHLLVMPLTAKEIMLSKIISNSLIILLFAIISMLTVVRGYFNVNIQGSLWLFFFGFILFQFNVTSLGIALSTFANNTAQLALLTMAVMMPISFLSGMYTPMESMAPILQKVMFLSPLKHCMDFTYPVIFRGAGFFEVWKPMLWMLGMGILLFSLSSFRFNRWFNNASK